MKIKRAFCLAAGLLVFIACLFTALSAHARQLKGSLSMQCVFKYEGKVTVLSGDTYAIERIALYESTDEDTITGSGFRTLNEYSDFDCDWAELTSMQLREKAMALSEAVRDKGSYLAQRTTDENGRLCFDELEPGLYLTIRTAAVNEDYEFEPSLIFIPQNTDGAVTYDVTCEPKFSKKTTPPTPSDPTDKERLPQTGQLFLPVFVLAAAGLLLTAAGIVLIMREKKHEASE